MERNKENRVSGLTYMDSFLNEYCFHQKNKEFTDDIKSIQLKYFLIQCLLLEIVSILETV